MRLGKQVTSSRGKKTVARIKVEVRDEKRSMFLKVLQWVSLELVREEVSRSPARRAVCMQMPLSKKAV